jgi:hypothetical protein
MPTSATRRIRRKESAVALRLLEGVIIAPKDVRSPTAFLIV